MLVNERVLYILIACVYQMAEARIAELNLALRVRTASSQCRPLFTCSVRRRLAVELGWNVQLRLSEISPVDLLDAVENLMEDVLTERIHNEQTWEVLNAKDLAQGTLSRLIDCLS